MKGGKHPVALGLMVVLSGLVGLAAMASLVPAMFSVMLFDAPGSIENGAVWVVFLSVVAFPLVSGATIVLAWLVFVSGRVGWALLCFALPLVPLAGVSAGFAWIEVMQGGQLSGQRAAEPGREQVEGSPGEP